MSFLYGFGLALAFVGLVVVALAVWFLFKVMAALSAENNLLAARLKKLEETPEVLALTPEDVRRIVLEMPARAGPEATPLDQLPREQMTDRVATDTFNHGAPRLVRPPSWRVAAFEAQQRKKATQKVATPQGGPGESE